MFSDGLGGLPQALPVEPRGHKHPGLVLVPEPPEELIRVERIDPEASED